MKGSDPMSFGAKFRTLREAKGMPQASCDEIFSLMRGTVSNWENGYADPEEELLPDLQLFRRKDPGPDERCVCCLIHASPSGQS